jgi:hypothetical protein
MTKLFACPSNQKSEQQPLSKNRELRDKKICSNPLRRHANVIAKLARQQCRGVVESPENREQQSTIDKKEKREREEHKSDPSTDESRNPKSQW